MAMHDLKSGLRAGAWIVSVLAACIATWAHGAVPWTEASYTYYADKRTVGQVLADFGQQFGLAVNQSAMVAALSTPVNGKIAAAGPSDFLNKLGGAHGLVWFYQGGTIYVNTVTESTVRSIPAPGVKLAGLKQVLTDLGIVDPKFGWGELQDRGIVMISGPPRYVDLVAQAVAHLPSISTEQHVAMFRLRYASVDDRTVFYRDKQIQTAGVATILRGLVASSGGSGGGGTRIEVVERPSSGLPALPRALPAAGEEDPARTPGQPKPAATAAQPQQSGRASSGPVILADSRLNAILIKDSEDRMPIYEKLIAQLDVPTALVEIEAMIIDVDANKTSELGIAWSGRRGNVTAGYGVADGPPEANTITFARASASPSTVLADAGNYLVGRVRLLESTGDAQVTSRPSVITGDNSGALFDLSETFHVQVTGERTASLVPVTTGVTLKVTPHIIDVDGKRSVQMVIDIQDGKITDTQIQSLPTVRNSTLSTQAVVRENESLLIGGYIVEERGKKHEHIPLLGRLPLVGALFGTQKIELKRRERMFLITPKIVAAPG